MAFTMANLVREFGSTTPDRPAATMAGHTVSFGELDRTSSRVANALIASGVNPGDRVAVLDKNSIEYYEMIFGAAKAGAVLVGVNFRLAKTEVDVILADSGASVVLVGEEFRSLVPDAAGRLVVTFGAQYEEWLATVDDSDPGLGTDPDEVVLQLYSSGTTGLPKGAMLSSANLSYTPIMGAGYYDTTASSVNILTSPLFHIGGTGYGLTTMGQGGHTVIMRDFDAVAMLDLIAEYRVTNAFLVPTTIKMLLDALDEHPTDLSSLHLVAYGGAPMSESLLLRAIRGLQCSFLAVYGMTETAGTVLCLPAADHDPGGPRASLLGSIGKPLPWHEVEVHNPTTGQKCAAGEDGEIWVRSGQNMVGYWHQPELTAATMSADGWLRTGDAAMCDSEGFIFMRDRLKDMIISGGENIYPVEVEMVLAQHPGIAEVVVIGAPHERWGESVMALVVPMPGVQLKSEELIEFCRLGLARYKCPRSIEFVQQLPKNASGKVLKRVLRDQYNTPSVAAGTLT